MALLGWSPESIRRFMARPSQCCCRRPDAPDRILRLQAAGINPQFDKVRHYRFGPLLGQCEVSLGVPRLSVYPPSFYRHLRVSLQDFSDVLKLLLGFRLQGRLAGVEGEPIKGKPSLSSTERFVSSMKAISLFSTPSSGMVEFDSAGEFFDEKFTQAAQVSLTCPLLS